MVFSEIKRRFENALGLRGKADDTAGNTADSNVVVLPSKDEVDRQVIAKLIETENPFDNLVLPDDLDLVVVDRGHVTNLDASSKERVSCGCGSCGGTSSLFSQRCDYCGNDKPFLRLKRQAEEYVERAGKSDFVTGDATLSNYGSREKPTVVYQVTGSIDVDKNIRAPVLRAPTINAGEASSIVFAESISFSGKQGVVAAEIRSQYVTLGKKTHAGTVRITENGSYNFEKGTVIDTLQLDRSIPFRATPLGVIIKNVVIGDFPISKDLRQFNR